MTTKSKQRTKQTGEVFTPRSLIREMLDRLSPSVWFDPNKRWLEPSAGDGNFLVEVKARLLQAGHDEVHILENMLFSVELVDDNHWTLQHRLGYLIDGQPNPRLNPENYAISKIHALTQDLNDKNPYVKIGCERDKVLHHRNHVCWTALEYDMSFGRESDECTDLPLLPERDLGEWPETDTPDIGERYVVEKLLGTQPNLVHNEPAPIEKPEVKVEPKPEIKAVAKPEVKVEPTVNIPQDPEFESLVNQGLIGLKSSFYLGETYISKAMLNRIKFVYKKPTKTQLEILNRLVSETLRNN